MAQISTCENSWAPSCVVATNYVWGAYPTAYPDIIWDFDPKVTDYYIRVLGYSYSQIFSMEIQFLKDATPSYYNWTTNYPFSGANGPAKAKRFSNIGRQRQFIMCRI